MAHGHTRLHQGAPQFPTGNCNTNQFRRPEPRSRSHRRAFGPRDFAISRGRSRLEAVSLQLAAAAGLRGGCCPYFDADGFSRPAFGLSGCPGARSGLRAARIRQCGLEAVLQTLDLFSADRGRTDDAGDPSHAVGHLHRHIGEPAVAGCRLACVRSRHRIRLSRRSELRQQPGLADFAIGRRLLFDFVADLRDRGGASARGPLPKNRRICLRVPAGADRNDLDYGHRSGDRRVWRDGTCRSGFSQHRAARLLRHAARRAAVAGRIAAHARPVESRRRRYVSQLSCGRRGALCLGHVADAPAEAAQPALQRSDAAGDADRRRSLSRRCHCGSRDRRHLDLDRKRYCFEACES
jgi:hypothetical protein